MDAHGRPWTPMDSDGTCENSLRVRRSTLLSTKSEKFHRCTCPDSSSIYTTHWRSRSQLCAAVFDVTKSPLQLCRGHSLEMCLLIGSYDLIVRFLTAADAHSVESDTLGLRSLLIYFVFYVLF